VNTEIKSGNTLFSCVKSILNNPPGKIQPHCGGIYTSVSRTMQLQKVWDIVSTE